MPFSKKTFLFFAPHQDDELLTMGIAIGSAVAKKHNVHVILCTDGSKSAVRNTLRNGKSCPKHEGLHSYTLSIPEFIAARDREFIDSCKALGLEESHIHIPEKRDTDGSLTLQTAEDLILSYCSLYGNNAIICTISPTNGPNQHRDHKTLGKAAEQLLNRGILKEVRFFIEPYHYTQIQANPRHIPVDPKIQKPSAKTAASLKQAIASYSKWNPTEGRYAVGHHSVSTEFDDFLHNMTAYSFVKYNASMGRLQRLSFQHRKWRKLHKQKQLFYSLSSCDKPDLGDLHCISIPAGDTTGYRDFCANHSVPLTEKNLQRISDGSSFWCLTDPIGSVLTQGWLAYKQHFYIGETDFGFEMRDSNAAILFDFATNPAHRGKGYYGLLLKSIVSQGAEPNRFLIYTSPDNAASSKGILKAGFQFDGEKTALDGSMVKYLRSVGFTSIKRKNRLWGLWVTP